MSDARRIVVTGLGAVSPLGNSAAASWDAALSGTGGIGAITRFDCSEAYPSRIAGEVKGFDPSPHLSHKEVRHYDLFIQYALAAAAEAIGDAGLAGAPPPDPNRVGVNIGSGIGGLPMIHATCRTIHEKGPRRVSPFFIPSSIINMASGLVSIRYGFRGPSMSIVSACTTSTHCIGDSFRMIVYGDADVMVCGGSEAVLTEPALAGFGNMRALSTRNDEPERASRPWDVGRDGFVLGEGAAVMVLEELGHAKRRGAGVYGEVIGYGMSSDAHHVTAPEEGGEGATLCMRNALADAKIPPDSVGYVNAHGTSTPLGDVAETKAIRSCFGAHADSLLVSSTKSMTGHLLGAAGALEAVFSVKAIAEGRVPPTINLDEPGEGCDLDYVANEARDAEVSVAISNSFGFGGTNATLAFAKA